MYLVASILLALQRTTYGLTISSMSLMVSISLDQCFGVCVTLNCGGDTTPRGRLAFFSLHIFCIGNNSPERDMTKLRVMLRLSVRPFIGTNMDHSFLAYGYIRRWRLIRIQNQLCWNIVLHFYFQYITKVLHFAFFVKSSRYRGGREVVPIHLDNPIRLYSEYTHERGILNMADLGWYLSML